MTCVLRRTLGIAAGLHALALFMPVRAPLARVDAASPEQAAVVVMVDVEDGPVSVPAGAAAHDHATSGIAPTPAVVAMLTTKVPSNVPPSASEPAGAPSTSVDIAKVAVAPAAEPKKPFPSLVDLSAPGKHVILLPAPKPGGAPGLAAQKKVDAMLNAGVDEKDQQVGLGSGGPVVSAAHDAAASAEAPEVGWVTFDVETDAAGAVIEVRLVDASDVLAWSKVGPKLKKRLALGPLKVPTGAAGVTVRVKVSAAMKLPSGALPGSPVTVGPKGIGVGGTFDLADIGQKPKRVVGVTIVRETRK